MAIDVQTLFKIVGEEGPTRHRVEKAMEWLLSSKAEGMGQELLHKAHELHGKPITIIVSAIKPPSYCADQSIFLHPASVADMAFKGADGAYHTFSMERILGHELVHAGQAELVAEGAPLKVIKTRPKIRSLSEENTGRELMDTQSPWRSFASTRLGRQSTRSFVDVIKDTKPKLPESPITRRGSKVFERLEKHLDDATKQIIEAHIAQAKKAEDYDTAVKHIEDAVDAIPISLQQKISNVYMRHQRGLKKYVETIEEPAIAVENRIAALRGEPIRANYIDVRMGPKTLRQYITNILSGNLEIDLKPRIISAAQSEGDKFWVHALGERNGRVLGG